jgi:phasin family protein
MTNQNYAFADMFRNMVDFNQLFSTQRRNIEALSAANQAMVEGAQAVSRRQAEVVRDNVDTMLQASKEMMNGNSPESSMSKQADFARSFFENTLANMREMTEMVTKSSFEAFDVLNKRAAESMEEISSAAGTSQQRSSGQSQKKKQA